MVFRIGCAKITTVATSQLGAETVRLLQRGRTVRQAREILHARLGRDNSQIDISPVVDALIKAKLVRTIDGRVVETERPTLRRVFLHRLQLSVQVFRTHLRESAIKYLPPQTAHRLICFAMLRRYPSKPSHAPSPLRENLRQAFAATLPDQTIEEIALEHHRENVRRAVDVQLLRNLPRRKMTGWLEDSVEFTGLDRIHAARREGRGAILCGFHFGAPQLLVPLLWRRGISFVGAAAIPPFRGKTLAEKLILDETYLPGGVPGCGTVTWYTRFSFRGFLEMMKAVEAGQTALLFPDGYFNRPNREIAKYFGHLAAEYHPSQKPVPFLGQRILANLMVPWLWVETRAPLLPLKLLRKSDARFQVVIEPPLTLPPDATVDSAAVQLYSALEQDVRLHPASWNYWGRLHEFTATATQVTQNGRPLPALAHR